MPPINPPIMFMLCIQLGIFAWIISFIRQKYELNFYVTMLIAIIADRLIYALLLSVFALIFKLPAFSFTLIKLLAAWPGLVIILLIIPGIARTLSIKFKKVDIYVED